MFLVIVVFKIKQKNISYFDRKWNLRMAIWYEILDDIFCLPVTCKRKTFPSCTYSLYFEPVDQPALAQEVQPLKENCRKIPYSQDYHLLGPKCKHDVKKQRFRGKFKNFHSKFEVKTYFVRVPHFESLNWQILIPSLRWKSFFGNPHFEQYSYKAN